jgi:hypothetical protein
MSENQVHRERSKHIDVRKYFARDLVEAKDAQASPMRHKGNGGGHAHEEFGVSII